MDAKSFSDLQQMAAGFPRLCPHCLKHPAQKVKWHGFDVIVCENMQPDTIIVGTEVLKISS